MKRPRALSNYQPAGANDIYALVNNLTVSERAVVRKSWNKVNSKKQPLHVHLFQLITDGLVNSDAGAQAALKLGGGAQFSNLKQRLVSEILDTLITGMRNDSPDAQLYYGLLQLQLLTERSQTGLARKLIKKLWILAESYGYYYCALELLQYRLRLAEQRSLRQYLTETEEICAAVERYTSYLYTAQKIRQGMQRILLLRSADQLLLMQSHHDAVHTIQKKLLGLADYAQQTSQLRLAYLTTAATAGYMLQQYDTCNKWCAAALDLLEHKPQLILTDPENFLELSSTAFHNEFSRDNGQGVNSWFQRFNLLATSVPKNEYFRKRWAIIHFTISLKIAHNAADYDAVTDLIAQQSDAIIAYADEVLPAIDRLPVIAAILISHFVLEQFELAETLMSVLKEKNRSLERQDIFYFTLIFHLVILYERKDWYRLETNTIAAYHVLYNRKKLHPFEKELMRFLRSLPSKRNNTKLGEYIQTFLTHMEVYRTDPVKNLYFLYFNYYDWLQSKLAGLSYREYRRRILADTASTAN